MTDRDKKKQHDAYNTRMIRPDQRSTHIQCPRCGKVVKRGSTHECKPR